MPLTFETLDAVPEGIRAEFTEFEGKFVSRDWLALKRSSDGQFQDLNKFKEKARAYETQYAGIDPEKARAALEAADKAEEERLRAEKQFEELAKRDLERATKPLIAERDEFKAKAEDTDKRFREMLLNSAASDAIPADASKKLLLPQVLQHLKVVIDPDGKYVVRVIGPDGEPRRKSATSPELMEPKDLVEELKQDEEIARAFKASGVGGSGAPAGQIRGGGGAITLSPTDAANHVTYKAALERAKKLGVKVVIDRTKR